MTDLKTLRALAEAARDHMDTEYESEHLCKMWDAIELPDVLALLDAHEKMRAALEFYADYKNWDEINVVNISNSDMSAITGDGYFANGMRARQALREVGE